MIFKQKHFFVSSHKNHLLIQPINDVNTKYSNMFHVLPFNIYSTKGE